MAIATAPTEGTQPRTGHPPPVFRERRFAGFLRAGRERKREPRAIEHELVSDGGALVDAFAPERFVDPIPGFLIDDTETVRKLQPSPERVRKLTPSGGGAPF